MVTISLRFIKNFLWQIVVSVEKKRITIVRQLLKNNIWKQHQPVLHSTCYNDHVIIANRKYGYWIPRVYCLINMMLNYYSKYLLLFYSKFNIYLIFLPKLMLLPKMEKDRNNDW